MSTWVQNSGTPPWHSYMETWVPQCGTVCMFQSVQFWSHTLLRICTCVRRCGTRGGVTETLTWGPPGAHMLAATMWRGGADLESQVDMPACADACTHFNQSVGTDELETYIYVWNYANWLIHTSQFKLTVIPLPSVISNENNPLKHNGSLEECTTVCQWRKHEHNIYLSLCTGSVQEMTYE